MCSCSLSGLDLNRQYIKCTRRTTPAVAALKRLLKHNQVDLFCDMHGHSRKFDSFVYGCPTNFQNNGRQLLLPAKLDERCSFFSFGQSSFKAPASKKSTGRVVAFQQLGLDQSYTLEASFAGSDGKHFSTDNYEQLGQALLLALHDTACMSDQQRAAQMENLRMLVAQRGEQLTTYREIAQAAIEAERQQGSQRLWFRLRSWLTNWSTPGDPDSESDGSDAEPEEACLPPVELEACWDQLEAEIPAVPTDNIVLDVVSGKMETEAIQVVDSPCDTEPSAHEKLEEPPVQKPIKRRSSKPVKFGPEDCPGSSHLGRAPTPPKLLAPVATSAVHATSSYDPTGGKCLPQVPAPNRAPVNLRRHQNRATAAPSNLEGIWKASERLREAVSPEPAVLPETILTPVSREQGSPQPHQGFRASTPSPANVRLNRARSWEQNEMVTREEELMAPLHAMIDPPSPTRLLSPNRPQSEQISRCFGFDESRMHREHREHNYKIDEHNYRINSETSRLPAPAARNHLSGRGAYTRGCELTPPSRLQDAHSAMLWSDCKPKTVTLKGDLRNNNSNVSSSWPQRTSTIQHEQQPQRLSTAFPRRRLGQPRHHLTETPRHITDTFTQRRQGLIKGRTL